METGIKSSFIPQAPITPARTEIRRRGSFDFFILLSLVIFVASATLAVGVFLYSQYLTTSAKSKLAQLDRAKAAFEPALIQDLTRLDHRMRGADQVLGNHIAPTELFHLLEQLTLQTISFSDFDFNADGEGMSVTMQGLAQSVNSVALQADLLSKSGVITNPIFSNINRQTGGVHFDLTAAVTPASLRYLNIANPQAEITSQEAQAPTQESLFGTPGEATQATTTRP